MRATTSAGQASDHLAALRQPPVDEAVLADLGDQLADQEMVIELIRNYLAEGDEHLRGLRAAMSTGDSAATVVIAHTLRSTSQLLGALPLASLLGEVERLSHASSGDAAAMLADVELEFARADLDFRRLAS